MGRFKLNEEYNLQVTGKNKLNSLLKRKNPIEEYNEEMFNTVDKFLVEFLDYSSKDEEIPDELLEKEREYFKWFKFGPVSRHLAKKSLLPLTSADIFYILLDKNSSSRVAKRFGVDVHTIKRIRNGNCENAKWEHSLVLKIMEVVKNRRRNISRVNKMCYIIFRVNPSTKEKKVVFTSLSEKKTLSMRKSLVDDRDREIYDRNNTWDVYLPIEVVPLF